LNSDGSTICVVVAVTEEGRAGADATASEKIEGVATGWVCICTAPSGLGHILGEVVVVGCIVELGILRETLHLIGVIGDVGRASVMYRLVH